MACVWLGRIYCIAVVMPLFLLSAAAGKGKWRNTRDTAKWDADGPRKLLSGHR